MLLRRRCATVTIAGVAIESSNPSAGLRPPCRVRVAVALLTLGTALMAAWCWGLRHDDAYVTFVFARHLGAGEGFVFNVGERVLGATSPLHVLLLAAAYRLVGDHLPNAAIVFGSLAMRVQMSDCRTPPPSSSSSQSGGASSSHAICHSSQNPPS